VFVICHIAEQECVGINLANQTGREGKLSAAYADAARAFATASASDGKEAAAAGAAVSAGFRLQPFDFHKECGATNYARLEVLWQASKAGQSKPAGWLAGCWSACLSA
jgi:hypothetical protein